MLTARVAGDSGLIGGRLLCGKHICRGRLAQFFRQHTPETVPADFFEVIQVEGGPHVANAAGAGDFLRLLLDPQYYEEVRHGHSVQPPHWHFRRDRARQTAISLEVREAHEACVIDCPVCTWPNLVTKQVVDAELVRRYAKLRHQVSVVRTIEEDVIHGLLHRSPWYYVDWYYVRPKGDAADVPAKAKWKCVAYRQPPLDFLDSLASQPNLPSLPEHPPAWLADLSPHEVEKRYPLPRRPGGTDPQRRQRQH